LGKTISLITIAILQLNSKNDKESNLAQLEHWATEAYQSCKPDVIALPEMFAFLGGTTQQKKQMAENVHTNGQAITLLKSLAQKYKCFIHGGSICEFEKGNYYNTSLFFGPKGDLLATYRKINLFKFSSISSQYNESILLSPGKEIVTSSIKQFMAGFTICFDIRFGSLFQELITRKVDMIFIPSAFTYETGKAHWEILCRARAIETQSYIIAAAQTGLHIENGQERACYGHSMIVDPWGNVVAGMAEEVGFAYAVLDKDYINHVRKKLSQNLGNE
jgi:deaminated glutathione amidase